jgi:hypothetical protein
MSHRRRIMMSTIGLLSSAALLAGVGACAARPAPVVAEGNGVVTGQEPVPTPGDTRTEGVPGETEPTTEESSEVPVIPITAKVGDTVRIADWDATVTKVTTKLSMRTVTAWNQFNEKPAKGQYVLVDYSAVYKGSARSADASTALTWNFGGADGVVYDAASIVTRADNEEWPTEARKGGKIRSQVVFDVPAKAVAKGVVSLSGYESDMSEKYADFQF